MEQVINELVNSAVNTIGSLGFIGGFILIIFESMIPILPLAIFIALNILTFGSLFGFLISWIATILGCMLMFFICRKLKSWFERKYKKDKKVGKFREKINNISYTSLVILMAIPFTPAFAVNIGAGLSDISAKKYLSALIIGKIPMVYFWGFIGKSFLESMTDISTLVQIAVMLILAFFVSKLANKYLNV